MASGPVGLWIDWDATGFGATGVGPKDLTALVTHASYSRGSSPEITGAAQAGQAVFTVLNPNALFNPDNASGPLYGLLRDGAPVWWGMRGDGTISGTSTATVYGRFAGRVVEVVPLPVPGGRSSTPLAQIICEDPLALYGRTEVALSDDCSPSPPPTPVPVYAALLYSHSGFYGCDPDSTYPDGAISVAWGNTGDAPPGGFIPEPLVGPIEYADWTGSGSECRYLGLRVLGSGTVSIHHATSFGGVAGGTSTITVTIRKNGVVIDDPAATQSQSHYVDGLEPFYGAFSFDVADVPVASGDVISVGVVFTGWAGFQWYAGQPGQNNEYTNLRVTGSVVA